MGGLQSRAEEVFVPKDKNVIGWDVSNHSRGRPFLVEAKKASVDDRVRDFTRLDLMAT